MNDLRGKLLNLGALVAGLVAGLLILGWVFPVPEAAPGGAPAAPRPGDPVPGWDDKLGSMPRFVDVTTATGISFRHEHGMTGKYHYPELMGAGIGLFDYNGDGLLDIYLVNGNHLLEEPSPEITNRLYRNNGDWTFTDVTKTAGVGDAGYGQGCSTGDYDNDGDPDLYVSNYGPNILYRNNGDGTFERATAGVEDPAWGQSCSFLDYDGDGWLDLYVQNYLTYSLSIEFEAFIYIGDRKALDYPNPRAFHGAADRLYRNNGDGTFTDVSAGSGIDRPDGRGMGCACIDFDEDGRVDIFVANDSMENFLFRNLGDGKFEEVGLSAGVAYGGFGTEEASMGVDAGDFDGDGRIDLIVPCVWEQIYTLYRNEGKHFTDVSWRTGLVQATAKLTGFSPNFLDYDNDGDLDLFVTSGGVRMTTTISPDASYEERYGIPDLLLASNGNAHYTDVGRWAGEHFQRRTIGRGSAAGDLDNDGNLDLVIGNLGGFVVILENLTESGNWIKLNLVHPGTNRDALGTSVWVEAGGRRQRSVVYGGVAYLSQEDRRVHFGLGSAEKVDRLELRWPDGQRQVLENLPVNRIVTIEKGSDQVK